MTNTTKRIGFIGLGQMGLPMARNLAAAGHAVLAFDTDPAACDRAASTGLTCARSSADAVSEADAVITMLPAGPHVLSCYGSGILEHAPKGALFIDCSSIDLASAKSAHGLASAARMRSLDAPVSGGIVGADKAALTFMVGGDGETFEAARPILAAMGRKIIHCGEDGAGQAVKMCNQMMVAANVAVVSEAFLLAEKLSIDPKVLYDVVVGSSGNSWALENYCPVPGIAPMSAADRNFAPGFTTALMLKDLGIFQDAARNAGTPSPVGAAAAQLYRMMHDAGYETQDYSAVISYLAGERPYLPARSSTTQRHRR